MEAALLGIGLVQVPVFMARHYLDSGALVEVLPQCRPAPLAVSLVMPSARSDSGYRIYQDTDLHHLRFIRQARRLGFSVEDVRRLLTLWQDRSRASAEPRQ